MSKAENIFIIGKDMRAHAMGWAIKRHNPQERSLFFAPGNGGTEQIGTNLDIDVKDIDGQLAFAIDNKIDTTLVSPEQPLEDGVVNAFEAEGLEIFGHTKEAAILETDKAEAVLFMRRHNIPHPASEIFTDPDAAIAFVKNPPWKKIVIKAAGLAEGKGVDLPDTYDEALLSIREKMIDGKFGDKGRKIVIQKRLEGQEISIIGFVSNEIGLLVPAQDYKRAYDGDLGPNTGGMGAYAPNEHATPHLIETVYKQVLIPTAEGSRLEGRRLHGPVYVGIMNSPEGIKVLEFNMRFGDPETQVQLRLLESDFLQSVRACIRGTLEPRHYRSNNKTAVGVVVASEGYPGKYEIGKEIRGLDQNFPEGIIIFHGGTLRTPDKKLVSNGGRVFTITNVGRTREEAAQGIYGTIKDYGIEMDDSFKRKDVAVKLGFSDSMV